VIGTRQPGHMGKNQVVFAIVWLMVCLCTLCTSRLCHHVFVFPTHVAKWFSAMRYIHSVLHHVNAIVDGCRGGMMIHDLVGVNSYCLVGSMHLSCAACDSDSESGSVVWCFLLPCCVLP
jgi:hypothetical protein